MNTMQSHGSGVPDMIGSLSEPTSSLVNNITTKKPAVANLKEA